MKAEGSSLYLLLYIIREINLKDWRQPANKQANNKMPKPYRFAMFQQPFLTDPASHWGIKIQQSNSLAITVVQRWKQN